MENIELTVGLYHRLVVPAQGQGVEPKLTIDPPDALIDLGYITAKDISKKDIKVIAITLSAIYQLLALQYFVLLY